MSKRILSTILVVLVLLGSASCSRVEESTPTENENQTVDAVRTEDRKTEWKLIERYYTRGDNSFYQWITFRYNENGNILLEEYRGVSTGAAFQTNEYMYDEYGNCVERIVYYNGIESDRYKIKSDKNGNVISEISEKVETQYKYDSQGNCTEEKLIQYSGEEVRELIYIWSYNESGDVLSEIHTDDGKYGGKSNVINTYNTDGKLIRTERKYYSNEEILISSDWTEINYVGNTEYRYDYSNDSLTQIVEKDNDEKGNVLEERIYYGSTEEYVGRTTYEYDEAGNMICQKSYEVINGEEILTGMMVSFYKLI